MNIEGKYFIHIPSISITILFLLNTQITLNFSFIGALEILSVKTHLINRGIFL